MPPEPPGESPAGEDLARLRAEAAELRQRLQETEDTLHAIGEGAVDAFVVRGRDGARVFTLEGADRPYRLLVERMQQGALTLDRDGAIAYANQCAADLLGVPHPHVTGLALRDFVPAADQAGFDGLLRDGRRAASQGELRVARADGSLVPVYLTVNALPEDGAAVSVLLTDLTAQKQQEVRAELLAAAEAAREEARARLAESTALTAFGRDLARAITLEEVGRIVSRWARALLGADGAAFVEREQDMARHVVEDAIGPLWAGQRFPISECVSGRAMVTRQTVAIEDVEADVRAPAPAYRSTFVRAVLMVPVREIEGPDAEMPHAAVGVYWARPHRASDHEIRMLDAVADAASMACDRTRLLARAERAQRVAERENRAKDEFVAMLSHELRNPLAAIASAAGLLEGPEGNGARAGRARDALRRQVHHLTRLVDDLLDVRRVTAGAIELHRGPLDVGALVENLGATWRASGRFDHHAVAVSTTPVWVDADETRLEQVLANLVGNALKFTPPGGAVRVRVARERRAAILEVADSGIGIAPEQLDRVFDLFVQAEPAREGGEGGLGIGLTLVRRLVALHGGTVTAHSDGPGRGSRFTVLLPAIDAPSSALAPRTCPDQASPRAILIVEDNDDVREMLGMLLERSGHTVAGAATGGDGLAMAVAEPPDVALIDIGLPGLDGYAVARGIRAELGGGVMLVALTGYGGHDDRERSWRAGFDAYLVKPVDPDQLNLILAQAPRRAR